MEKIEQIKQEIAQNKEVFFKIKAFPAAKENKIELGPNNILHVKITAAPDKDKANQAIIKFLAAKLGLRRYQVEIHRGKTVVNKTIKISR